MIEPPTIEFVLVAVAVGIGSGVGAYMAARRNEVHREYAFIVREFDAEGEMDGTTFEQLSFDQALEKRNEVLDDMADQHSGWLARAAAEMRKIPVGEIGLAEDFRRMLLERGVPEPKSPNVWGPFTSYMVRQGLLSPTGTWRPMRSAKSNGRVTREYRRAEPAEAA